MAKEKGKGKSKRNNKSIKVHLGETAYVKIDGKPPIFQKPGESDDRFGDRAAREVEKEAKAKGYI